ncbi:AAHS family benzoate transporter-like MFS transporter/AAHS family 4-hydroxybenzoate transporter-like MFS transporter [Paraburkholderia sp. BL6665CI2N2]|uniref:MFS transporter n=1 Tax=Paraburkholderia sp. BL6665CI2N2 TaxID=1938806 RepID=UPI0010656ED2|nr:MFS transporter [Paraburkholderia sp. BL6665CI2N2]TDY15502.1 AAHS family benzoate transporter-like MFS transporter/AAHS family 4-hydroxybenzoate transporter-like MFS transporter [Paraburkholderia sp. BL6665CI2N2]
MENLINAREELAHAPIGRFHIRFAILVAFIMFFDGYDLFNAAYVIPLIRKMWNPSPSMIGIMLSSGIVGLSVGSVLQGLLSDRIGRRKVMLLALWLLTVASAALATVVDSPLSFSVLRLLLGIALGMVTPLALTCINEWAPRRHANTYATWVFMFGFSAGGIFAGVAGITLTAQHGWQSLYVVGILSAFVALAATFWLPESIQYLALNRRYDQVRKLLATLRPERAHLYRDAKFEPMHKVQRVGSFADLLSPLYRRNTIVHWITGFLSLFCIHGLTGWLPTLVVAQGQGVSSGFAYGTLVMIASVFGGISMGWFADKVGSRIRVMIVGYLAAALSLGCLALFLGRAPMATIAMVAMAGFFIFGSQAILNNYQAMCYRTEVRGTGIGVAIGLNRVGGILGPLIVGVIASINPSPFMTFALFCGAAAAASIVISFGKTEIASIVAPANDRASELHGREQPLMEATSAFLNK